MDQNQIYYRFVLHHSVPKILNTLGFACFGFRMSHNQIGVGLDKTKKQKQTHINRKVKQKFKIQTKSFLGVGKKDSFDLMREEKDRIRLNIS